MFNFQQIIQAQSDQRLLAAAKDPASLSEATLGSALNGFRLGLRARSLRELRNRDVLQPATLRRITRLVLECRNLEVLEAGAACLARHPDEDSARTLCQALDPNRGPSSFGLNTMYYAVLSLQATSFDFAQAVLLRLAETPTLRDRNLPEGIDLLAAKMLNACSSLASIENDILTCIGCASFRLPRLRAEAGLNRKTRRQLNDAYRVTSNMVQIASGRSEPALRETMLDLLLSHSRRSDSAAGLYGCSLEEASLCRVCALALNNSISDDVTLEMVTELEAPSQSPAVRRYLALALGGNLVAQPLLRRIAADPLEHDASLRAEAARGIVKAV